MHFTQIPGKFLIGAENQGLHYFAGSDSQDRFEDNLKKRDANWHYRTKNVVYQLNKQGYRATDFDSVDWNNSIVVFGCSNVFGVGLAEDETLSHCIQQKTGITTINMGIAGGSMFQTLYNQMCLNENGYKPVAIVHAWTDHDRVTKFEQSRFLSLGPWNSNGEHKSFYQHLVANRHNNIGYANLIHRTTLQLCRNMKFTEFSFFERTASYLNIDYFRIVDTARDMLHPGRETTKLAAEKIIQQLNL